VRSKRFSEFQVGQVETFERVVTADDVRRFVELTGDTNPLHLDDDYAATVGFEKGRIVNGLLTASFVATLIGTRLPGPGALELSQKFNFRAPVQIGETVRVEGRIRRISPAIRALVLDIAIRNGQDVVVLDGEAVVQLLEVDTED
jgi:acyl dehydratase